MSDTSAIFGLDNFFYHASVRRYVALFGTIFSDIYIQRTSADGTKQDTIKIPIQYAAGNMYLKASQDPELREQKQISRILPAMAFNLENIYKDVSRKTNPMNRIVNTTLDSSGQKQFQFNRIPYNFLFDLTIRTKNMDDMLQIVEQVIPAFDGNLSVTIQDTTGVAVDQDIIISVEEIDMKDDYDEEMQTRLIEYKITFELKGYLYKRTQNSLVIREIDIQKALWPDAYVIETDAVTDQTPIQGVRDNLDKLSLFTENLI